MERVPSSDLIYVNADSIVYVKSGKYPVSISNYFGVTTNELTYDSINCRGCKDVHYIKTFVASAPKSYSYVTDNNYLELKCKGASLTNKQILNLDKIKDVVDNKLTSLTFVKAS